MSNPHKTDPNLSADENSANHDPAVPMNKDSAANRQPPSADAATEENEAGALAKLQSDLEESRDLALRTRADFDNFRKRALREKEDAIKFANRDLLEQLIPIIDNFELGLLAANSASDASAILVGFEMVNKQLQDFLTAQGVEVIDATGKEFDHHLHEALGQETSDEVPEGHVVRQIRKGYKLRDRLIRPANVFISKGNA